jgi:hypothetical protein
MSPERCAYCGALAENPVQLRWVVEPDRGLSVTLALCVACSQSWCPQTAGTRRSADRAA